MPLVDAAREGDPQAMDGLVRALMPDLRAYVRLNVGQQLRQLESCSDLVQSVCREVVEDIGDFGGSAAKQFRRWLFTVALRKIQTRGRHHGAQRRDPRRVVPLDGDRDEAAAEVIDAYESICSPSRHASAREEIERVEAGFEALPDDYREVLTLTCIVGLSHREVAEQMGRAETAVRKLLFRARARLALLLASDDES